MQACACGRAFLCMCVRVRGCGHVCTCGCACACRHVRGHWRRCDMSACVCSCARLVHSRIGVKAHGRQLIYVRRTEQYEEAVGWPMPALRGHAGDDESDVRRP